MANRFLETNYFKSPFVRSLKGSLKGLYSFIICDCTAAGIWSLDLEAASLYTGFDISINEFQNSFVDTGKAILISRGKYFFPDFIEHQYPSGLQSWNKSHNKIIIELKKLDFLSESKAEKGIIYFIEKKGAFEGLQSPQGNGNNNGNGLGNGNGHSLPDKKNTDVVCYDVEEFILGNQKVFEKICIATQKKQDEVKTELHLYHLWLAKNEKYPMGNKAAAAGIESWIHNSKQFKKTYSNGTESATGTNRFNAGALQLLERGEQKFKANARGKENNSG